MTLKNLYKVYFCYSERSEETLFQFAAQMFRFTQHDNNGWHPQNLWFWGWWLSSNHLQASLEAATLNQAGVVSYE